MPPYDPFQTHRKLWNDPEKILNESLSAITMMHENLLYVESCQAVVRRDFHKLTGKVRIIGGGALIDGPMYTGFIGQGMLTAATLGLDSSPSSLSSDSIFNLINHIAIDEQEVVHEILLLVHDCPEYFLNFLMAKNKAEGKGIPIKLIFVRDEISEKLNQKPSLSPRSPSGLLLVYKIAGAMADDGKTLNEIFETCQEIIQKEFIFSIGVYIIEDSLSDSGEIEICKGDRLSDRNIKRLSVVNSTTQKVIESIINDFLQEKQLQKFPKGSKLTILLDYFGGFSNLEANIIIKELVQQLNQFHLKVEIIISGMFHTSLELNGFHLSILNISSNSQFSRLLNASTTAYSWPKKNFICNNSKTVSESQNNLKQRIELTPKTKVFQTDILITAIEYACEALIACATKIDMLDGSETVPKCGTRLSKTAEEIKYIIKQKKFDGSSEVTIIFQIAQIFQKKVQDPQAKLYEILLFNIGRAIECQKNPKGSNWLNAFIEAINEVTKITKQTKIADTLLAAKVTFLEAFTDNKVNIIDALGYAVNAAQNQTSHVILKPGVKLQDDKNGPFGLAGAHAIGVWMRGAYEGIKLKYVHPKSPEKRANFNDENKVLSKISKLA